MFVDNDPNQNVVNLFLIKIIDSTKLNAKLIISDEVQHLKHIFPFSTLDPVMVQVSLIHMHQLNFNINQSLVQKTVKKIYIYSETQHLKHILSCSTCTLNRCNCDSRFIYLALELFEIQYLMLIK